MGRIEKMTASASGSVSPRPNECRNASQGRWRPERPFLSYWARCGGALGDTEPLFNPVHPANPVLQLQLQLAMR
jgi:hypothetical protein